MATLGDDEIEQRRAAVPEWQRDNIRSDDRVTDAAGQRVASYVTR